MIDTALRCIACCVSTPRHAWIEANSSVRSCRPLSCECCVPAKRNAPDADPRRWYAYQSHRNRAHYQLKTEPLCRFCKQEGRTTPATVADHVIPVDGDWWRFRMGELQSLCYDCHDRVKRTIELHGYSSKVDISGWPIDPNHPVYGQRPEP